MIGASRQTLSSKVGRRIFSLFVLAAFLPIALISVISYDYIRDQIADGVRNQIHTEIRAIGLNAYDRMLIVENALEILATGTRKDNFPMTAARKNWMESLFQGVTLYAGANAERTLVGDPVPLPDLNQAQRQYLSEGGSVIAMIADSGRPLLVMLRMLSPAASGNELLVAQPRASYLWNFGVFRPTLACAVTARGDALACSSTVSAEEWNSLTRDAGTKQEIRSWHYDNARYAVSVWNLFLEGNFRAENVDIVLAIPMEKAFFAFNSFKAIYPKSLLVTLLLVVVLSMSLIRKHLDPLNKLMLAINQFRDGKFRESVKIRSGDEFETLAGSFNEMADRIGDQLTTLELMSRIDQLILSAGDTEHVVKTLTGYLQPLTGAGHVAVLFLQGEDRKHGVLYFNADARLSGMESVAVTLPDPERLELASPQLHIQIEGTDNRAYLDCLRERGDTHFLVFPMRMKEQPIGLVCLGDREPLQISEEKLDTLHEIANRISVALINKESEKQLFYQAHYDALTNLPNRYLLNDRLEQALSRAERKESAVALLFIDLDRFKSVNDSLGHTIGDELLVQVTDRLASCIRDYDTMARFGGDEFIVIAEENSTRDVADRAAVLARRILGSFKLPLKVRQRDIYAAASIGISIFPFDGRNADDLLKSADVAMYQAKAGGRNTYRFFESAMNSGLLEDMDLGADLRHALEREELSLVYQPKISCRTLKPSGAEVLVRWNHPTRGLISTADFIQIAEEIGLIREVGDWVLRKTCLQIRDWRRLGIRDFQVAVNLSALQFREIDFSDHLKGIIRDTGILPSEIELEITESITMMDVETSAGVLNRLHDMGVSISIDDFGTGHSSLSYLQQFNVHRLKVDQSFIKGTPANQNSVAIVRAILALGHSLGLEVTAEGVESEAQFSFVREAGFDEIQGYYISRPLDAEAFEQFCLERCKVQYS